MPAPRQAPSVFLQQPAPVDLFLYGGVEDEDVVDDEESQNEGEAGGVAPDEGYDRVGDGDKKAAQVQEGENRVEQRPFPAFTAAGGVERRPARRDLIPRADPRAQGGVR